MILSCHIREDGETLNCRPVWIRILLLGLNLIKILAILYALLGVTWGHLLLRISCHNVDKYQNPCNFICTTWCDLRPSFVENLLPQCWQVSKSLQFYMYNLVWLEAIFCWESLASVDQYQNPCNFICTTWCDLRPSFVENLLSQCWQEQGFFPVCTLSCL